MQQKEFHRLIDAYLNNTATPLERELVEAHVRLLEENNHLQLTDAELMDAKDRVWEMLRGQEQGEEKTPVVPMHTRRIGHIPGGVRAAAAAVIILMVGAVTWWLLPKQQNAAVEKIADVKAPAINRAMITRGNGETVYLDSAANGQLAHLGNTTLEKLGDGKIAYSGNTAGVVETNTISNPRGSKVIDITLTDGTHIWLNAGSSLTYTVPLVKREVSVTGEAYFEVAHDAARPFTVARGEMKVTVLGTHFNVNAYDDEAAIKVTLLEGSVSVHKGNNKLIIKPGQQAMVDKQITLAENVDVDQVMAWKNGLFNFDHADIETVMKQVARWYDVEVVYESKPATLFGGGASRTMSAANVFKALEETGGVHFVIEGKKVIVKK